MKIGYSGIDIPEGKVKYNNKKMNALVEKDKPKKVVPFYAEFVKKDFVQTDVIVIPKENILDILILDMEKCEARHERSEDDNEKKLMIKCINLMESEVPLCDGEFSEEEHAWLQMLAPLSYKPVVQLEGTPELNDIIDLALEKSKLIFFYTAGPKEVHAWQAEKGSDIITCAGKIHTDLARGFIKGDVVSLQDYLDSHSFNDCKKKGVVKVVDRDHVVEDGDIIEIRFNV